MERPAVIEQKVLSWSLIITLNIYLFSFKISEKQWFTKLKRLSLVGSVARAWHWAVTINSAMTNHKDLSACRARNRGFRYVHHALWRKSHHAQYMFVCSFVRSLKRLRWTYLWRSVQVAALNLKKLSLIEVDLLRQASFDVDCRLLAFQTKRYRPTLTRLIPRNLFAYRFNFLILRYSLLAKNWTGGHIDWIFNRTIIGT